MECLECIKCNLKVVISAFCYGLVRVQEIVRERFRDSCLNNFKFSRYEISDSIKIKTDQIISMRTSKIFVLDFRECKVFR